VKPVDDSSLWLYLFPFTLTCNTFLTCSVYLGYLPNSIEAVEAMLAAASIGAIWSSTSPDFGVFVRMIRCQNFRKKNFFYSIIHF
jgi:hypothetical protein